MDSKHHCDDSARPEMKGAAGDLSGQLGVQGGRNPRRRRGHFARWEMDMDDETVAPVARAALMNTMLGPYVAQYCRYLRHIRCKLCDRQLQGHFRLATTPM
jgi:hypothetical protein